MKPINPIRYVVLDTRTNTAGSAESRLATIKGRRTRAMNEIDTTKKIKELEKEIILCTDKRNENKLRGLNVDGYNDAISTYTKETLKLKSEPVDKGEYFEIGEINLDTMEKKLFIDVTGKKL